MRKLRIWGLHAIDVSALVIAVWLCADSVSDGDGLSGVIGGFWLAVWLLRLPRDVRKYRLP